MKSLKMMHIYLLFILQFKGTNQIHFYALDVGKVLMLWLTFKTVQDQSSHHLSCINNSNSASSTRISRFTFYKAEWESKDLCETILVQALLVFTIPSAPKVFRVVSPTSNFSNSTLLFPKHSLSQQLSFWTYIKSVVKHLIEICNYITNRTGINRYGQQHSWLLASRQLLCWEEKNQDEAESSPLEGSDLHSSGLRHRFTVGRKLW